MALNADKYVVFVHLICLTDNSISRTKKVETTFSMQNLKCMREAIFILYCIKSIYATNFLTYRYIKILCPSSVSHYPTLCISCPLKFSA